MISICMIIRIVIEGDPEPSPGIYSLEGSRISCLTEEGCGSQQVSPLPSPASELLSLASNWGYLKSPVVKHKLQIFLLVHDRQQQVFQMTMTFHGNNVL